MDDFPNIGLDDGATTTIDGINYVWDKFRGRWIPLSQWISERGYDPQLKQFTKDDFGKCNANLYSYDCFANMIKSFKDGEKGLDLMKDWISHWDFFNDILLVFMWPIFDVMWLVTFWMLWLDPELIPSHKNISYYDIDVETASWYEFLSF